MSPDRPATRFVELPAGSFRLLEWSAASAATGEASAVFLHGLSGVAEVWTDTVVALGANRPRCIALDQRGHGHSPRTPGTYAATDYLGDLMALIAQLDGPVHLVGHSMGARVAILAAARHPEAFTSATIVDIGPEAWAANIAATSRIFDSLPEVFAHREAALALGRAGRGGEQWAQRFVDWRLAEQPDGTYTWLASKDGLIETVTTQRARNYWHDWERVATRALLVRGGTSNELRQHIVDAMRRRNPSVGFVEIPDVGHNVPLLAPDQLAAELTQFWAGNLNA